MKKAHVHLVEYAINKGFVLSVFDGEEWAVKQTKDKKEILAAIDSVEESQIIFRTSEGGKKCGWALIIDQGSPEETVCDFTDNEWMNEWFDVYSCSIA